jgi:inorganic pyrophosphatase/exopolyphosphatase
MNLKFKTKSGEVSNITVDELLEVDGKPFRQGDETEFLTAQIARLDGRLMTIERALFPPVEREGIANG